MNSGAYHDWLVDAGSLTLRLQLRCHDFAVQPTHLINAKPRGDEAQLLSCAVRQRALLREVRLHCRGKPVVFAHSVLPYKSLRGAWQGLGRLGSKPLGGALFADPRVTRAPLQFKKLTRHHPLYRLATAHLLVLPDALWARRSVFSLKHAVILVTEVFLPLVLTL
jgi:chorismate--pyruvate lyase